MYGKLSSRVMSAVTGRPWGGGVFPNQCDVPHKTLTFTPRILVYVASKAI